MINKTIHELKIETSYFEALLKGDKNFELRYNDRGFQKGENLLLKELEDNGFIRTGREITAEITYVLNHTGLKEGWVALALKNIELTKNY